MYKAILYIHGKGGSYKEAEQCKKNCEGFDIVGVDFELGFPWVVKDIIIKEYEKLHEKYNTVYVIANSIGAYFTMNALQNREPDKAFFISPILNMEKLILNMMIWANVTEQELSEKKEIETDFGETLSWEYLQYVRNNPLKWSVRTEILYAGNDNLTSRETVDDFIKNNDAGLTVIESGEHWFHTEEQLDFLNRWMQRVI